MASCNLITEPFLPVTAGNQPSRLTLREALLESSQVSELSHPSPLITMAGYRLLLAILQRIFGAEPLAAQYRWWKDGRFPAERIEHYFAQWHDRFDLFSAERPFLQLADFTLELSRRPVTALQPEAASGNNKLLFDHSLDRQPAGLKPADAALALLAAQCFALGGGRSAFQYTAHAPSATAAQCIAQGDNLFQTLLLNLLPQARAAHAQDQATWERERPWCVADMRDGCTLPVAGPAQLYSLPARSIRLHPETTETDPRVRWISLASGATVADSLGALRDPMVSYRLDEKRGRVTLTLDGERAFWRDFQALRPFEAQNAGEWEPPQTISHAAELLRDLAAGQPVTALVCAQASDKAKVELWREERFPLAPALYRDAAAWGLVHEAIALAETAGKALASSSYQLAQELLKTGEDNPDKRRVGTLARSFPMLAQYWSQLGRHFDAWLLGEFPALPDDAARLRAWLIRLRHTLMLAWRLHEQVVMDNARGDRAVITCQDAVMAAHSDIDAQIKRLAQPEEPSA